jgi:hypothetical protein
MITPEWLWCLVDRLALKRKYADHGDLRSSRRGGAK